VKTWLLLRPVQIGGAVLLASLATVTVLLRAQAPVAAPRRPPAGALTARRSATVASPATAPTPVAPATASPSPSPSLSPAPAPDLNPHLGSTGAQVLDLQKRLTGLMYMAGTVDGRYGAGTRDGVIAFQKVEGLPRTGEADPATLASLATATTPAPAYATPADHVEVDIAHQVVYVVQAGTVTAILPTSTGGGETFTEPGSPGTHVAITPNGVYSVYWKVDGWHQAPLGDLYKPSFFDDGIALHGYPSVPTYPASHGCVRLPMEFADWFFANAAPMGSTVYVYGGANGPNPDPVQQTSAATAAPPSVPGPALSPLPSPTLSPAPQPPSLLGGLLSQP
jgi:peptidoglycan hydrolase-like protein with peptidoglycan-binding domain